MELNRPYQAYDLKGELKQATKFICPPTEDCNCLTSAKKTPNILEKVAPDVFERCRSEWGIFAIVFTLIGALVALILFCYLLHSYPVRGGTTVLGFVILFAVFLLFLLNIAFVIHASPIICTIRRFFLGTIYALIYSALLIKSVDEWRLRHNTMEVYKGVSQPLAMLLICLSITATQVSSRRARHILGANLQYMQV